MEWSANDQAADEPMVRVTTRLSPLHATATKPYAQAAPGSLMVRMKNGRNTAACSSGPVHSRRGFDSARTATVGFRSSRAARNFPTTAPTTNAGEKTGVHNTAERTWSATVGRGKNGAAMVWRASLTCLRFKM